MGSNGWCDWCQGDGSSNVAPDEGSAHLKYKIRVRLLSNSARFQNFFLYICDFLWCFLNWIFNCCCVHLFYKRTLFFYSVNRQQTFCEQTADILWTDSRHSVNRQQTFCEQTVYTLNLKHSPDLLFLMTDKLYRILWIVSYFAHLFGECFEWRFYWTVRVCKLCDMEFIDVEFCSFVWGMFWVAVLLNCSSV
jgi:hypothetical protein